MQKGAYGFGIARSIEPVRSRARLGELCEMLSSAVGAIFLPTHVDSYRRLVDGLDGGELGVAWVPPIPCIELEQRAPSSGLLLPVRRGSTSYNSALIALRSGPRSLSDVKGKRVAWVDPDSSAGYLVPRLHLQAGGRKLGAMFSEELMAGSHAAVLDAVESGRVDVGATYCSNKTPTWHGTGGRERPFDVLTMAGPIPNDAIVVSPRVPAEVRARVLRWLIALELPRARELCLDLLGAEAFRLASFSHYTPLRRLLHAAKYGPSA